MSGNMEINQVLAQMRAMALSAKGSESAGSATAVAGATDFSTVMKSAVEQVSATQGEAGKLVKAFEAGEQNVELPEVMVALQKASVSFQAMTQVRNKLLSAYQEVMNMQV